MDKAARVSADPAASDPERRSDAEVIAESRDEPEVFAEVFDRHWTALYRYAVRRLGPDVAEDLVGDAFLVAFERRDRFDTGRTDALPWLFGILTKLMSRHRRSEAARYRMMERSSHETTTEEPADRVASTVSAVAVRPALARALADLRAGDRDVLLLAGWADLSYEEISAALSIPVGTVRSRLHRARRKMRAALGNNNPLLVGEMAS
jgi:RNA polymerase sigma factor (sigma-70 family)